MTRYTLFSHPLHSDTKKAERILRRYNIKFHLSDVTANGVSSYILKDMGISELPALCIFHGYRYKIYEGLDEIQDFLMQQIR